MVSVFIFGNRNDLQCERTFLFSAFQNIVIRRLAKLEEGQKEILMLLRGLSSTNNPTGGMKEYFTSLPAFPLTHISAVSCFDQYLSNDEDFERAVSLLNNKMPSMFCVVLTKCFLNRSNTSR